MIRRGELANAFDGGAHTGLEDVGGRAFNLRVGDVLAFLAGFAVGGRVLHAERLS